jgi:hypothetical protein
MMAQGSVPKICHHGFRFIEPLVDAQVASGEAAEFSGAVLSIFQ